MSFFDSKKKEETIAVFDIGSGSVGGALVRVASSAQTGLNETGKSEIFSVVRKPIAFQKNFSFQKFLSSMLQALGDVSKTLTLAPNMGGTPHRLLCFLASPWYASQTRTVKFSKTAPFTFTKKLADSLVTREIESFEHVNLGGHLGPKGHASLVESKTMLVKLNGYFVSDPIGKKATEVEMTLFLSMSPESILLAIKEAVGRVFGKPVHFFSFPLASFFVCRALFKDKPDFILMDVGSEITDVSLIRNNIISESLSFPLGKNFLIRSLMSGLGQTQVEASSTLTLYLSGKMDDSLREGVARVLQNAQDEWLKYFHNALTHLTYDLFLPSEVMLTADTDVAAWFVETIKKEEYNQNVLTAKGFNVRILDAKTFSAVLKLGKVEDSDPFLMLEAIFAEEIK